MFILFFVWASVLLVVGVLFDGSTQSACMQASAGGYSTPWGRRRRRGCRTLAKLLAQS